MNVRYHVKLSRGERAELGLLLQGGAQAVRKLKLRRSCWRRMQE